jgi:hypothetical protein
MARLAAYASRFEELRLRGSYTLKGNMALLDGSGKVESTKLLEARIDGNRGDARVTVLRYLEDGKDKTGDAVKEAREADARRAKRQREGRQLKMPRYAFDRVESSADGTRTRIAFAPIEPADDTIEGSAWVDVASGSVLSSTFRMSKTSLFVSYVHVSLEFEAGTSLGRAISRVSVEGEGGILFFRKHFRGTASLSSYTVAP